MNFQSHNSQSILPSFLTFNSSDYSIFPQTVYSIINDVHFTNNQLCPICLNIPKTFFRPNTCNHLFCRKCLYLWQNQKKNCPMCRKPFKDIIKI